MCPFAAWCSSALLLRSVKLGLRGHFSNVSSATESWSLQADTIRWPSWNSGGQNSEHTSWTLTCWAVNASSSGISQDPSSDRNLCGTPIWVLRDCFISFAVFPCFSIIQDHKTASLSPDTAEYTEHIALLGPGDWRLSYETSWARNSVQLKQSLTAKGIPPD